MLRDFLGVFSTYVGLFFTRREALRREHIGEGRCSAEGRCQSQEIRVLVSALLFTSHVMLGELFYLPELLFTQQ